MKEKEFLKKMGLDWDTLFIKVGIFYTEGKEGHIIFDFESMEDVFKNQIKKIKEVVGVKD